MYLTHYGLSEKPFQISPDPRFLWLGKKHKEALAFLKYGILNNQGFLLLTGDVGTGKTTIINALMQELSEDVLVATIRDPKLSMEEFFKYLAEAFNFNSTFDAKQEFISCFSNFLHEAYDNNKKVLLIIDESQTLSYNLLEQIRLLSNIELPHTKLINIFFVGQNELLNTLYDEKCRALLQRITLKHHIGALTTNETKEYIRYRLKCAGAQAEIFGDKATREIYAYSKGYPRLINIICDHALLTGFVKNLDTITADVIRECVTELTLPSETLIKDDRDQARLVKSDKRNLIKTAVYIVLTLLTIGSGYFFLRTQKDDFFANIKNFYGPLILKKPEISQSEQQSAGESQISQRSLDAIISPENGPSQKTLKPIAESEKGDPVQSREARLVDETSEQLDLINNKLVIPFGFDAVTLPDEVRAKIDKMVSTMQRNPNISILIKGYTDTLGNYFYNVQLSTLRANIVKSYLVGKGVDPVRIQVLGLGEKDPVGDNRTSEGRAANRRVEIELIQRSTKQIVSESRAAHEH
jgi:general secretion pathway protein A